ncbi:AAA family ATPase, partial [Planktothrix sp.]
FDEIEKANPKILDKFLQILEDGRLTDGKGQTAYFNQTAIIFTSNIGASDFTDPQTGHIIRPGIMNQVKQGDGLTYEQVKEHFQEEVKWHFTSRIGRAELLSRLGDNIVVFDLLRPEFIRPIGEKLLSQLKEAALDKYRLNLEFQDSIFELLSCEMADGDNLLMGGRGIKTVLETLVERPLNRWIFEAFSK